MKSYHTFYHKLEQKASFTMKPKTKNGKNALQLTKLKCANYNVLGV